MPTGGLDIMKGERSAFPRRLARLAACLALVAAAILPLREARADDLSICRTSVSSPPDQVIAACDRLINAGNSKGAELAARYDDRGIAWYRKGELDRALGDYNKAIALDPKFGIAHLNRGLVWHSKGQYDQALADYDKAISLGNVDLALAHHNRGNSWRSKGDLERTLGDYNTAIALDPKRGGVYLDRGNIWHNKGQYDQALADYDKAISLGNVNLVFAYNNRGNSWRLKGDLDRALADLSRSIDLDPKFATAYSNRGQAWMSKGNYDSALADFNKVIELDPKNADAYNYRGVVFDRLNNKDPAISDYAYAIMLRPSFALAYRNRAKDLASQGKLESALADLDQAINFNPKYIDAYFDRADLRSRQGDFDAALADLDKVVGFDPKNVQGHQRRGLAFQKKSYADGRSGLAERRKLDLEQSLQAYDQAIALSPKVDGTYVDRANTLAAMDNLDGAIASLNTAINLNPNNAIAYGNRCIFLRRKKDIDGALADCSAAIRLDPGYTGAYSNRGQIFESRSDTASAIADYAKAVQVPAKYETGPGAHDFAKARLAVLAPGGVQIPAPPVETAAASGGRLALVIGNGAYAPPDKLDNPPNDARAVAQALRGIGFDVIEGIDLDHAAMLRALRTFLLKASSARIALMYYAGHGVQIRGENYLVPTDAKLLSEATVELELINLDKQILDGLNDEARANIVILDACRNNPFANVGKRGGRGAGGLAIPSTGGSLVAFATDPNNVAQDGDGAHSPYTTALLQYIADPNLDLVTMLRRVQSAVRNATHGEQNPFISLPPFGDVYLARDPKHAAVK
jgi:tetratricopeptide (TPR) repeat protein